MQHAHRKKKTTEKNSGRVSLIEEKVSMAAVCYETTPNSPCPLRTPGADHDTGFKSINMTPLTTTLRSSNMAIETKKNQDDSPTNNSIFQGFPIVAV